MLAGVRDGVRHRKTEVDDVDLFRRSTGAEKEIGGLDVAMNVVPGMDELDTVNLAPGVHGISQLNLPAMLEKLDVPPALQYAAHPGATNCAPRV